jgi:hypothetical protein
VWPKQARGTVMPGCREPRRHGSGHEERVTKRPSRCRPAPTGPTC